MNETTRRDFLKTTAGLALATLARPAGDLSAKEADGNRLKKAVKYSMVQGNASIRDKFQMLKELGYDGVELSAPNELDTKEVLAARDATGLPIHGTICSTHWSKPLSDAAPAVQEEGLAGLRAAIDAAKTYGATTTLLVPAVVTPQVSYQEAWERSQANIRKVLPYAQEQGIKIGLENVWSKFLLSPLEFARYIDEFESPSIGAYFDVGNVVEFGYPQQWIRTLGPRIIKADIKEYAKPKRFDYPLGEGEIDWKSVREAFAEIGYYGFCTAEIKGGDREYLKDVAARMNTILGIG